MTTAKPIRQVLPSVLFIVLVSFMFFMARSMNSPLLIQIEEAFGVSHTAATRSFVFYSTGNALVTMLSGFVLAKLVHRKAIILAGAVGTIGLLVMASASSLGMFRAGLVIFGSGFGLYMATAINTITLLVQKPDWPKAMAISELSPHLGMIAAPLLAAAIAPHLAWRPMFLLLALGLAGGVTLFALRVTEGNDYGVAPTLPVLKVLFRKPAFWLLIVLFALGLAATDGIYLLIPTFLITEAEMSAAFANTLFGFSRFLPIGALLIGAVVVGKIGIRRTIVIALAGSGTAVLLLALTRGGVRAVMIFLQPALGALFFPAGFAADHCRKFVSKGNGSIEKKSRNPSA